ncbi:uncharacterized protein LOC127277923 [Leptopilina boulardi]|uniref:uncharacterized protein LOC127277923 n=1 Tax=Leptopilina boulardi TaxID=63433 RepID=UPI0021F5B804|nr:uncharacterized protein LOC127277923 [Leptopilina boulardi]
MRFRQYPVAIKGDIQDMFLRVKVRAEDQNAQSFLWRGMDRKNPPKEYVMTSLIFGSKSSPCSANYIKNTNAREFTNIMSEAVSAIINNTYMDDFLLSVISKTKATKIITQVSEINSKAGFHMHEWSSNSPDVLKSIEQDSTNSSVDLRLNSVEDKSDKVLGLRWDTNSDTFTFNLGLNKIPAKLLTEAKPPTKREFLKIIMSIFDPLGFLSPFTVKSKILMQEIWISGINWDSPLADDERETWQSWLAELRQVGACSVQRCYLYSNENVKRTELHVFCDASKRAYAAVAYWRFEKADGQIETSIIANKSRVAPLKPLSIPRLELQAALLGSRLAQTIEKEHNLKIDQRILWSDSRTVILWLKSDPRFYHTFVAHRLGEICELTSPSNWRWVPTNDNPADDATKFSKTPLNSNQRWFFGPPFLKKRESDWPDQTAIFNEDSVNLASAEKKGPNVATLVIAKDKCIPVASNFSSYKRLLGSTAQMLLAIDKMKGNKNRTLSVEHLQAAEKLILIESQKQSFSDEIKELQHGSPIKKSSRLANLNPKLSNDGLLRLESRVADKVDISFDNEPIILDGKHHVTRLLLEEYHIAQKHGSPNTVINEIRQKYWILNLRNSLRSIGTHCQYCKLRSEKPKVQIMGKLPSARLAYKKRPFSYCGLDYFGPLSITVGKKTRLSKGKHKRWVALFTCLTTRAIHLELVDNLSADSAIMALCRMSNRRGRPLEIHSDNGTNFRGADKELRESLRFDVQQESATRKGIKWCFIPPGTPHMGGSWERMIRSVKVALKMILKEQSPKEETLRTLLTEVEHSVNSRPLTDVSLDPRDDEALTPNHFLIGTSSGNLTYRRHEQQIECPKKQWEIAQYFADCFWKRWLREYLPTLLPRKKWHSESESLKIGEVVVIADHQSSRNMWLKGIVERTFPGRDNLVRVVEVRTIKGTFIRPIIKLIKLTEVQAP